MENKNVNIKEIDSLPQLEVLTFMSWDNNYFVRNNEITLRAIALCYPNGFFKVAINCMRVVLWASLMKMEFIIVNGLVTFLVVLLIQTFVLPRKKK